ncbi:hypothetical protein HY408_00645 [Candidatus Gottesmanbacteria bacterium]|nr:hypothetical protein [Candidatus Gottesmanbacteria bacterium]
MYQTNTLSVRFIKDAVIVWSISLSVVIMLFTTIFIAINWKKLPPYVPLFYSLPWGEEQLSPPGGLLFFLGGFFAVAALNTVLGYIVYRVSKVYARFLVVGTTLVSLLMSIAVIQIILRVT